MNSKERANSIIKDILVNHLPKVQAGLEQNYVDENQILVIYDHAVRARILIEQEQEHKQLLERMERVERALLEISSLNAPGLDGSPSEIEYDIAQKALSIPQPPTK